MLFRDRTYSVLTVSGGEKFHRATKALLPPSDYWPVDCAMSAAQARRMLSEKEYDLLLLFARNPRIALYRETIYERVWGGDFVYGTKTVDLHVQRMRKKVGWEGKLVAVNKVGYRLEV